MYLQKSWVYICSYFDTFRFFSAWFWFVGIGETCTFWTLETSHSSQAIYVCISTVSTCNGTVSYDELLLSADSGQDRTTEKCLFNQSRHRGADAFSAGIRLELPARKKLANASGYTDWVIKYAKQLQIFFIKSPSQDYVRLIRPFEETQLQCTVKSVEYNQHKIVSFARLRELSNRYILLALDRNKPYRGNMGKEIKLKNNFI